MREFPLTLLADLECPCCRSAFEITTALNVSSEGISDAILRCDCYEYPVVHGIPILRQLSPVSSNDNGAVNYLRQRDVDGARRWLLSKGNAPGIRDISGLTSNRIQPASLSLKIRNYLKGGPDPPVRPDILQLEDFETVLHTSRPSDYASYLFQRFANPSFLGAIPPAVILGDACRRGPRRRVIELLCGTGHLSATISALCPGIDVVMLDIDYTNLFIAQRFLAPDTISLCMDAELPLPFKNESIDGLFCLDGLHYVRSKAALMEQVDRVMSADGIWLSSHTHNASSTNINPGAPLDTHGYAKRFAFGQQRMLPESEVLRQFREQGCLDLTNQSPLSSLDSSNALTIVGARNDGLWKRHCGLDDALTRRPDLLALNPLYKLEKISGGYVARVTWPSDSLREECAGNMPPLPDTLRLSTHTLEAIAATRAGQAVTDEIKEFVKSFVLVPLPKCYPRGVPLPTREAISANN